MIRLRNYGFLFTARRTFSKDGPKVACASEQKESGASGKKRDQLDTTFTNHEAAFKSMTTTEIIRAYVVYTLCSVNYFVENNVTHMKTARKALGKKVFTALMKMTFYGHFVGGEDLERVAPTLKRLHSFGVRSILDYSVEEDLSSDEAEKREMESTRSEFEKAASPSDSREEECVGGEMPQYHADKSFADRRRGVDSARTYFYLNEELCDKNLNIFLEGVNTVAQIDKNGTGFAAIKLTALGRPQLLLQLSEVIMRAREFVHNITGGETENLLKKNLKPEELADRLVKSGVKDVEKFMSNVVTDREGVIHLFPWTGIVDKNLELSKTFRVPCPKAARMVRLISKLSEREEEMFRNMIRRLNKLLTEAREKDVRILVDAEQTYFQPAISRITLEMMNKYNLEKAIACNTYQCYLKNTLTELTSDLKQAKRQKFHFGCKLVRGAYMDQERERAASLGYLDPINPTYESTTEMYHNAFLECLRYVKDAGSDGAKIMAATHNEDTVRFAVDKMKEFGVKPEDGTICFGQLYGMSDDITFPMGQAGYAVYKYLPYGPVEEVLPYLSRRAHENKGILNKVKKEKSMLLRELRRRVFKGQIFHKPQGEYTPALNNDVVEEIRS